jgi:polar amino acid transport system substrate-binding protein
MRTKLITPLLVVAAVVALSGCVDNSEESSQPTEADATQAITVDEAAAALLPADIASAGKLVIGTDPTYAPNEYKNDAGEPIGWGIDLGSAVAQKLGLEADFQIANFDKILPSITGGTYDIGISSFGDTVEREETVDFVNYYNAGNQWLQPLGKDIDPADACGKTVAVWTSSTQQTDELPAKSKACTDAGKEAINIMQFDSQAGATDAVVSGRADAMSADAPIVQYAASQLETKVETAGDAFDVAPYGMPVMKGSELAEAVQAALQSLVDDGTYDEILERGGITSGGLSTITINAASKG